MNIHTHTFTHSIDMITIAAAATTTNNKVNNKQKHYNDDLAV